MQPNIPSYQEFMRPLLEIVQEAHPKEVKLSEILMPLADKMGIPEEERTRPLPKGKNTYLKNRIGWAKTYLDKAKLLQKTQKGYFVITPLGQEALASNANIDNRYLKQFDSFIAFLNRTKEDSGDNSQNAAAQSNINSAIKTVPNTGEASGSARTSTVDNAILENQESPETDTTPDEALRDAYRKINNALAEDILDRTRQVTPAFFENLLIDLLLAMGYGGTGEGAAHALGKSGDNGIDGVIDQDPLGVDQVYIQAKRYAEGNNIGAGDIRNFFGALNLKKAQKGIFITTSDFTPSAKQTAQDLGMRIVLINGTELAKLMLRYNIGSRDEQVLYLKKIDEEFFEG